MRERERERERERMRAKSVSFWGSQTMPQYAGRVIKWTHHIITFFSLEIKTFFYGAGIFFSTFYGLHLAFRMFSMAQCVRRWFWVSSFFGQPIFFFSKRGFCFFRNWIIIHSFFSQTAFFDPLYDAIYISEKPILFFKQKGQRYFSVSRHNWKIYLNRIARVFS